MGTNKSAARNAAVEWWRDNAEVNAVCDGRGCSRPIAKGEGYLCKSLTFGAADMVCETCFDRCPYEPWTGGKIPSPSDGGDIVSAIQQFAAHAARQVLTPPPSPRDGGDIDSDPAILDRQMQEVLKSLGFGAHVVQVVIPTDADLPPAQFACDQHFHLGEAYLAGNQARLAIRRFEQALSAFDGGSAYEHFVVAVKLALAEAHSAIDVEEWQQALRYLNEVLAVFPDDDRAHAIKARVHVRAKQPVEAYVSAMAALKSCSKNFEAGCYLGVIGFQLARADGDVEEMAHSVQNLKITQDLYAHPALALMIRDCEMEMQRLRRQA